MLRRTVLVALLVLLWLVVAVPAAALATLRSSEPTVLAGHEVTIRPTLDGWATFDLGPYLPDFRHPSGSRVGAHIDVGKTTAEDYDTLVSRYAVIASQPEGQVAKLRDVVTAEVRRGALLGGLLALAAPAAVVLVGRRRWSELRSRLTVRRTAATVVAVSLAAYGTVRLLDDRNGADVARERWQPLADALPSMRIPEQAAGVQIDSGLMTRGTTALLQGLVTSYRSSLGFYEDLREMATTIGPQLHQPADDETVALLVSDRHDNINMDPVAREVADQAGATVLLDAGDDTSTGGSWEAFSLESLDQAFDDYEHRYSVAGNHDHGDFVTATFGDLGFTTLVGEPVEGPDGIRFLGASDPRSSGLGAWIDEKEITFAEQTSRLADAACAEDADGRRVSTLLVHDVNAGAEALARGCVDLVVGGHRHSQVGPDRVVGSNGQAGYRYVNGTTGGAAYAIALGGRLRREAQVTLVTYRDGRPVGLQPVSFRTVKEIVVSPYVELQLEPTNAVGTTPAP